jgi:NitT/TauT family transport system ATP-binding protein
MNAVQEFQPEALTETPMIQIRDLAFSVRDKRRKEGITGILSNVHLTVWKQEFVSIVGPSGCGKSTLLNFISGLLPVQSGSVSLALPKIGPDSLGYVFQRHGLLPWRSILKNVELGLEIVGMEPARRKALALDMLGEMGLTDFAHHYPREISGGMCQRAALARTLALRPQVILMDEPFGALDAQTRIFIQEMFIHHWEAHRATVLFTTHDISESLLLSDRVLVMGARPGQIVAEYRVDLERPRDYLSVRHTPCYHDLHDSIWNDIRTQTAIATRDAA